MRAHVQSPTPQKSDRVSEQINTQINTHESVTARSFPVALTKNITELGKRGIVGHSPGDIWSVSALHLMIKILPQVQSGKMTNRECDGGGRGRERKTGGRQAEGQ